MKSFILYVLIGINYVYADISGMVVLNSTMNQKLSLDIIPDSNNKNTMGNVNIVFSGSTQGWYGVGFNNSDMKATYAIIVDSSGITYEYYLGSGTCSPGCCTQLRNTYSVNSNTMNNGVRTVNITRGINDNSNGAEYFTFPTTATDLKLIYAWGIKGQLFADGTDMAGHGQTMISLK